MKWHLASALLVAVGVLGSGQCYAQEPKERNTLKGHTASVMSVALSGNGKSLASGSWDKTVKLWDVTTGKITTTLEAIPKSCFPWRSAAAAPSWPRAVLLRR